MVLFQFKMLLFLCKTSFFGRKLYFCSPNQFSVQNVAVSVENVLFAGQIVLCHSKPNFLSPKCYFFVQDVLFWSKTLLLQSQSYFFNRKFYFSVQISVHFKFNPLLFQSKSYFFSRKLDFFCPKRYCFSRNRSFCRPNAYTYIHTYFISLHKCNKNTIEKRKVARRPKETIESL